MLRILQVNLGRSRRAMDLTRHECNTGNKDIALVAEPNKYMARQSVKWLTDEEADAAIYIPHDKLIVYKRGSGTGYVWIELEAVVVYSCYIPPPIRAEEFQQILLELGRDIKGQKKKLIIGGDFNAKSHSWGSPVEDKKGSMLAEFASEADLTILNTGTKPTFEREGGSSYIDVTLCTGTLAATVERWHIGDEENLSHHNNIHIDIRLNRKLSDSRKRKGWIYNKNRMEKLLAAIERGTTTQDYRHTAKELARVIEKACDDTLRKKDKRYKQRATHWWNEEIAQLRRDSLSIKRRVTRNNRDPRVSQTERNETREQHRISRNALKKAIKRSKRQAWKALCEELDADLWGTGYKIVTGKLGLRSPITISEKEQHELAKQLFPERRKTKWPRRNVRPEGRISQCTAEEIREAGRRLKAKKAPGPDGVPPEVIKAVAEHKPQLLVNMMNRMIEEGIFPREWKAAKLALIEKPSKPGKETEYRPLCLLNAVAKLYEQVINKRLQEEMATNNGLSERQFGFRKQMSTLNALELVQEITREETAANPSRYVVMITLDVKNAFNSAPWPEIVRALKRRGTAGYLTEIACSYLEDRKLLIGETTAMDITCGVPQGSVLGPTLWNIFYDDVLRLEMPYGTHTIGYADDLALVVCGGGTDEIEEKVDWAMHTISIWMDRNGLSLAQHKTEAVVLQGRRTVKQFNVITEGGIIPSGRSLKYLGVTIGHNMNMGIHIKTVAAKAERAVAALTRVMPNIGGPKAGRRRVLGKVVDSIILYAAPAWSKWTNMEVYRKVLERPQRKAAIRIASAYRTVSTKAIQVIAGTIPIHLLAKERTYGNEENRRAQRQMAREATLAAWQREWDENTDTAQWTKRLIPDIIPWLSRKHGEVGYHLTQLLSGHGCFRAYLTRFKVIDREECTYCGRRDTPEHSIFECSRWDEVRERMQREVDRQITPDNIINEMLSSDAKWTLVKGAVKEIIETKEEEER